MGDHAFNVVLVHGGFVDGSGWEPVYQALRRDGYDVSIVQNPTISLEGDVAATKLVVGMQDRPTILVGHSPILPPRDGFLFLDKTKFHASFAGDVVADKAAFMADSQVP